MDSHLKKNTFIVKSIFFILTLVMILQLFRVQVLENSRWSVRSEIRDELRKTFQATRGSVFFSDGSPLAVSQLAYGVFALPDGFNDEKVKKEGITREGFADDLAIYTGLERQIILERISNPKLKYVALANKVDSEIVDKIISKYPQSLNIWTYEEQSKRVYPDKQLAAKIIGFVGRDEQGNDVGRYGIESYFDGVLRGTEGVFEGKKDSKNQVIVNEDFSNIKSRNGIDVTLTIDRSMQLMLEERMWYWMDKFKSKEATAVIMEPNTGKIMAIVNLPTFDPNEYWKGEKINCDPNFDYYILNEECNKKADPVPTPTTDVAVPAVSNDKQVFYPEGYEARLKEIENQKKKLEDEAQKIKESNDLKEAAAKAAIVDPRVEKYSSAVREVLRTKSLDATEVYRDAANSFIYEPGSIEKVITLAIAYNFKAIPTNPDYSLGGHNGCEKVQDVTLCTAGKLVRSAVTVESMLQLSDNVGALRVAKAVDIKRFVDTLGKFGLGKSSGVELGDESVFNMKDPSTWTRVDQATASYGQGSLAFTPIQMTNAWNILASGGRSYKPTIVKEINDNGKQKVFEPVFIEQVVDAQAADDALNVNAVATSNGGRRAQEFYSRYPFSGKTGTADIPKPDGVGYMPNVVNTSYIGIAPLNNPKFTMLVWFREPRATIDSTLPNGGNTAQVAWIDIADRLMVKMNVAPQNAKK